MTPEQRENWVLQQMFIEQSRYDSQVKSSDGRKPRIYKDSLDAGFVDDYILATGASYMPKMLGAHYCRDLGATFLSLYKQGLLDRWRQGMSAPCGGGGWPTWVWSYYIPEGAINSVKARLERSDGKTI